ncbi:MAG: bifunctional aminotransferase class I/II-fold pyridoxal phosphate-dependent enzyme/GNAT family N-acetyltransferase [Myxococcota bacterium]
MQTQRDRRKLLERAIDSSVDLGIGNCHAEDDGFDGRHVRIRGRALVNFASCSYLGLELDPRLIDAAIDATRRFGIETSSSRAYLSAPLYTEFESLIEQVFGGAHVVVAPTTTLGHLAAMPALIDDDDAVILDHQVHSSVQMAAKLLHAGGTTLEVLPHNHLDRLEDRVVALSKTHRHVWYMADGVYSMFGDLAPVAKIASILDRHEQMRFYVDDAHGMSWCGPNGAGSVLEAIELHPRMILATGMAKGFGTGGGLIVSCLPEVKKKVRRFGPTLIFAGPLQPPILGAAIASARIHLSPEIGAMQAELRERLAIFADRIRRHPVPVVSPGNTPVGFVGTGPTQVCQILCARLMDAGYFTNPAQFPATPARRSGNRFLISRHHAREDLEGLADALAEHWEPAVREAGVEPYEIWRAFDLEPPVAPVTRARARSTELYLESADSIDKLRHAEWDALMRDRGCLTASAMTLFERLFGPDAEPENRWDFRYYVVRDGKGAPVLATCFTAALWKADMMAPPEVSARVEARRASEPLFLTHRVFAMGCLLSEGHHLWLRDPVEASTSQAAISLLLRAVRSDSDRLGCSVRVLRDLPSDDLALAHRFASDGMMSMAAPESLIVPDVLESEAALVASLGRKHRYHQARYVAPFDECYDVEVLQPGSRLLSDDEVERLYRLYENVRAENLELNTFPLPRRFLREMAESPSWELLIFRERGRPESDPVCFLASFIGEEVFTPLLTGLDYRLVRERGLYRQMLRHGTLRARALGRRQVHFGFGAGLEKRRFGARPHASTMFLEADDHYAFDALAHIAVEAG